MAFRTVVPVGVLAEWGGGERSRGDERVDIGGCAVL
jgi:hypothetical protein